VTAVATTASGRHGVADIVAGLRAQKPAARMTEEEFDRARALIAPDNVQSLTRLWRRSGWAHRVIGRREGRARESITGLLLYGGERKRWASTFSIASILRLHPDRIDQEYKTLRNYARVAKAWENAPRGAFSFFVPRTRRPPRPRHRRRESMAGN
jgi:hypothetical protein